MNITLPTSFPAGTPEPAPVENPLSDYIHRAAAYVAPLDCARETAREALAKYEGTSIHDDASMIKAAVALGMELRGLLTSLDAVDAVDAAAVSA